MALQAGKLGFRYAVGIGGTTLLYCVLDEGVGMFRERYLGIRRDVRRVEGIEEVWNRSSWREGEVFWEDGAVAGGVLGAGVAVVCEYALHWGSHAR
jgi:hypothetical protein